MGITLMRNEHEIAHLLRKGKDFEDQDQLLHAIQVYSRLIDQYPGNYHAYSRLVDLYARTDREEHAAGLVDDMIARFGDHTEAMLFVVDFLSIRKQFGKSLTIIQKIRTPDSPITVFYSGMLNLEEQHYTAAYHDFQEFLTLGEDQIFNDQAYLFLARITIHLKKYQEAEQYLTAVKAAGLKSYDVHLLEAMLHYELNMITHAEDSIRKALRKGKYIPEVMAWTAKIYLRQGEYEKLLKLMLSYQSKGEVSANFYKLLGHCYRALDMTAEADTAYRTALGFNAADPELTAALLELNR